MGAEELTVMSGIVLLIVFASVGWLVRKRKEN